MKGDYIEAEAVVIAALPNALFKIKLDNEVEVIAHISGRIRQNSINILVGDRVKVQISPYDMTKARIVRRFKEEK